MEKKGNNTFILGVVVAIISLLAIGCICYVFTMLMRENNKNIANTSNIINTNTTTNTVNNLNNNNMVNNTITKTEIDNNLESKKFTISRVQITDDGYILYTHLLADEPRMVSQVEYNNILNGGSFKFRGREWLLSKIEENGGTILKEKNSENEKNIAIRKDATGKYYVERTGSGAIADLADYKSEEITTYTVKNTIKCLGTYESFEYDKNTKEVKITNSADMVKYNTIGEFVDVMKTCQRYDTHELYGQCTGYFLEGNMIVIQCRDE